MVIDNLFNLIPCLHGFRAKCIHTFRAQVLNLSSMWVAIKAKVIKEYVNFKVPVQDFAFVLSNIFRAELHFTSTDVVPVLNKCSIEHDAADHSLRKALVIENYFGISAHRERIPLFFRQEHVD